MVLRRRQCTWQYGPVAEMIGATRARVSFFMNKFRKLGLIDYNGHIEIHSSLLNVVLHDGPHISAAEKL
jgi:CRP/FNR family cyclic AMP-dependent transcriptional regulator